MSKCDVVIPVYKSPEWVELCLYALFLNTEEKTLNQVILVNDCDDPFTKNCLNNLKSKYGEKIVIKQNKENYGFTKTANIGLRESIADYVLLLNTDCLISRKTIEKLMHHMQSDPKIGMICPISSNAANLSLDMLEGFTYMQMNELLEERFSGKLYDACTVVGNCLMYSKKCIDTVGLLDEIYSPGYGEETDYQFKAMEKGFSAKVAADTYVFHKAETSFGISEKKQKMIEEHLSIFFSRWGDEYYKELEIYNENDPVKQILEDFKNNPPKIKTKAMFYMDAIGVSGGCNVIVDIINRLAINGQPCNIIYEHKLNYPEVMLFNPVPIEHLEDVSTKKLVATLWVTAYHAKKIANEKKWELLYLVQGIEQHFSNGKDYGAVEISYKLANKIITVSKCLQVWLEKMNGIKSYLIENGINLELLKTEKKDKGIKTVLLVARNDYRKCDYVVLDILRRIDVDLSNINVNIIILRKKFTLPQLNNKTNKYNIVDGPLPRAKLFELMRDSDVYIDTSQSEGFGLTALESMAMGCIPIVSDSFGVRDYLVDEKNGLLVKEINDAEVYLEKIKYLAKNKELRKRIYAGMEKTVERYDFLDRIDSYVDVFVGKASFPSNNSIKLSLEEKEIVKKIQDSKKETEAEQGGKKTAKKYSRGKRIVRKAVHILPKFVRKQGVRMIEYLKSCY